MEHKFITKFTPIDDIYQANRYLDNNIVLEILQQHRILEERYITNEHAKLPIEFPILGEEFHKKNIETIDHIIENIGNGQQNMDALIYLYPFLIHRYSSGGTDDLFPTVQKFQDYFDKVRLNFDGVNTGYIYASLMRFFTTRKIHSYSQEFVDQIVSVNDNNSFYVFRFCCVLMYDKEFYNSLYHYDGTMHRGAYISID